jgi:WD40 repeat protein
MKPCFFEIKSNRITQPPGNSHCPLLMKLWRNQTLVSPQTTQDFRSKVTALCYTRDNKFLGVATSDRLISIYDEQGNRVDKFNTKPNNKGPKDYIVRSIQFGPEVHSPKLVVGQTDCIVFVYKWSTSTNDDTEKVWGGRSRFVTSSSRRHQLSLLFGQTIIPHNVCTL